VATDGKITAAGLHFPPFVRFPLVTFGPPLRVVPPRTGRAPGASVGSQR
jgi:hypothetical protein